MHKLVTVILSLVLLAAGGASAEQIRVDNPSISGDIPSFIGYVENRFIVVLNEDISVDHGRDAQSRIALSSVAGFEDLRQRFLVSELRPQFPGSDRQAQAAGDAADKLSRHYKVTFDSGTLEEAMAAYAAHPAVDHVEPIGIHTLYASPNDTYYDNPPVEFPYDQWHYWDTKSVHADSAWDVSTGQSSVKVGILDSGTRYYHIDIGGPSALWTPENPYSGGNVFINPNEIPGNGVDDDGNGYIDDVVGYDFVETTGGFGVTCTDTDCGGRDNNPDDGNGHGTHVSGTVAAISNNARQVAGVAGGFSDGTTSGTGNGVEIIPCRIGYNATYLGQPTGLVLMDAAAEAMYYLGGLIDAGHNVTAINCSWGSSNSGGLAGATDYLLSKDVVIVVAAGNSSSTSASYLGTRGDCFDVAATDQAGNNASFTNYGSWVDIAAPGVEILSTYANPDDPDLTAHYIAILDGTSMSAPHVAGCVALLESCDPSLTASQKMNLLMNNSDPYGGTRDLGAGIANVWKAFQAAGCSGTPCDLVANFSGSPLSGDAPLTVNFTDLSVGSPTGWSWTFGDGGSSTLQNPSHQYTTPGTYSVTLTATSACGTDAETKSGYVTVSVPPAPPVANFSGTPTSGAYPLNVQFTDLSSNDPTSWSWDFGDGVGTSTAQNPSYTYQNVGTYTVSLTASNAYGSDIETKVGYITVTDAPMLSRAFANADMPVSGTVSGSFLDLQGSDNVRESITEVLSTSHPRKQTSFLEHKWTVNVGAGGSSMMFYVEASRTSGDGDNFVFAYSLDDATYTNLVTVASTTEQVLSAPLPAGVTGTVFIRVLDTDQNWENVALDAVSIDEMYIEYSSQPGPPVADFGGAPTSGEYPLNVQFTDASTGSPTSWSWNFGDGVGTSTAQNPSYTYQNVGTYTVSLTASNAYGSDIETKVGYITVTEPGQQGTMHVANISVSRGTAGANCFGRATVVIQDANNQPVANATVSVTATGPVGGSFSGVTDGSGSVSFETVKTKSCTGQWCFEVTNVTHASLTYDSGANVWTSRCEDGTGFSTGSAVATSETMPTEYGLAQNYPNPFNPSTEIAFSLPNASDVRLEVFNVLGQRVALVAEGNFGAGMHSVTWDASSMSSGVYFYRLTTSNFVETRKMMLMK